MQAKARRISKRTLGTLAFFMALNMILGVVLWTRLSAAHHIISGSNALAPLVGHPAPDFTLVPWNDPAQPSLQLSALKGKPIVLNVWASWCGPCKQEAPMFESAWLRHQPDGVVFLGIDYQDQTQEAQQFLHDYGITYPAGPDASGAISVAYGVSNVPTTIFIDRAGIVVRKILGPVDAATLEDEIHQLLK